MNPLERLRVCEKCELYRNPGCAGIRCCSASDDDDDGKPKHDAGKWRVMLHDQSGQWCPLQKWTDDTTKPDDGKLVLVKVGNGQIASVKL